MLPTNYAVECAIDYIEEHLNEPLQLERIAKTASMSLPHLYRMFYAMTGHPVKEYIRKRRVSEAAVLLRQSGLSAIDIGFRCGFDSYQTFIQTFKRYAGMTPGLYRKAELVFSFERISLSERVAYMEEREVTERYPEVKVIRLAARRGMSKLFTARQGESIEEKALFLIGQELGSHGIDFSRAALFGWNVDLDRQHETHGYEVAVVPSGVDGHRSFNDSWRPCELPGGLYAVTYAPAGDGAVIEAAWNRIVSEWLPQSAFELERPFFLEEYQQFNGKIARMKLYLPVRRQASIETIRFEERLQEKAIVFRAEGGDGVWRADQASVAWLERHGLAGDERIGVGMSCSFPPGDGSYYEVILFLPEEELPLMEEGENAAVLGGGWYACLRTAVCGSMTGVLEKIYRWLETSDDCEPDGERDWYVRYIHANDGDSRLDEDGSGEVYAECRVPIRLLRRQGVKA
ncbi:helix-turn-helix domain-containing protein [Paenibacillus arenilitoris]|uniref:AraC family transcriptional regulator n=1 Tax=Paenibacillus arenilitoris TaxID=2772299 RepID=A0A927H5M5_9BACL|nr:AraC family transcriptional regulator [Paenibacillus arenilitoris]MBD2868698.1 AraC family transcriptional regulator [Paenibacillus arenilitoris]